MSAPTGEQRSGSRSSREQPFCSQPNDKHLAGFSRSENGSRLAGHGLLGMAGSSGGPKDSDATSNRCLAGATVTCDPEGSRYLQQESCGAYGCTESGGQAHCDFPDSTPPDDALNDDGNFDDGGATWHVDNDSVQLTNGMVCIEDDFVELGWPSDPQDAATLTFGENYRLRFRTSVVERSNYPVLSLEVKVGSPETPFTEYFSQSVDLVEGVEEYVLSFTMGEPTGPAGIVFTLLTSDVEVCVDEIWLTPY